MSLEIVIKSGAKTYNVSSDPNAQVSALKKQLESIADVPANLQRLIYSGRVLKDEQTLESLGLKNGHTIHLVKGQKPATAPAASSPAPAAPPLAAGQGTGNVLSDLTGARYAGLANLPSASIFGPDGGMGPAPDADQLMSMLESPEYAEAMQQIMQDPESMINAIGGSMPPEQTEQLRQMLQNPEFRQLLADPQAQRQALRLSQQLRGMEGADGASGLAGLGSLGENSALGALGGLGGLGGLGALGGASAAPAPADTRPPEERYESQLNQLNELGFYDFDRNVQALRRSGGNVQGAIEALLDGQV